MITKCLDIKVKMSEMYNQVWDSASFHCLVLISGYSTLFLVITGGLQNGDSSENTEHPLIWCTVICWAFWHFFPFFFNMKIGQIIKKVQAQKLIQTRGSDIDNWVKYFILQPILLILVQGVNKNQLNIFAQNWGN